MATRNNKRTKGKHSRKKSRKPQFIKNFEKKVKKFKTNTKRKISGWFKRNRLKLILAGIALIIILGVVIAHMLEKPSRISEGDYVHADRFDGYTIVNGVDVSYAQGGDIDWKKLKRAGVDFVFVRCGYRASADGKLHPDEFYEQNLKGAHDAGLLTGAYFFSQALTAKEAAAEAKYLVEIVDGYEIDLPLVMDYETYPGGRLEKKISSGKLGAAGLYKNAIAFAREVEKNGYDSAVYGNYSFLTHTMPGGELSKYTNIWVAQYANSCDFEGTYNFWQCTDSLKVNGISGNVDRNFWYLKTGENIATGPLDSDRTPIGDCRIELKNHNPKYWSGPVKPGVIVSDGGRKLKEGRDYTVGYVNNSEEGTAQAVVSGIGDYKDKCAISFRIK